MKTCPTCDELGFWSMLYQEGSATTLAMIYGFYEKDGYHFHDTNRTTYYYRCTQGHQTKVVGPIHPCPNENCDWGKSD